MPWVRDKPAARARMRERSHSNRAYIAEIRSGTFCAECGAQPIDWHNPAHMQYPGRRVSNLTQGSRVRIDAEIAVSIPLCRRCHMAEDGRMAMLAISGSAGRKPSTAPCVRCGASDPRPRRRGMCSRCYDKIRRPSKRGTSAQ